MYQACNRLVRLDRFLMDSTKARHNRREPGSYRCQVVFELLFLIPQTQMPVPTDNFFQFFTDLIVDGVVIFRLNHPDVRQAS